MVVRRAGGAVVRVRFTASRHIILMDKSKIKKVLNLFPEVNWDRYTEDGKELEFYGWIPRPDGRFDFIDIFFIDEKPEWYATSSARLSKTFHKKLKIKWPHPPFKMFLWSFYDCKLKDRVTNFFNVVFGPQSKMFVSGRQSC